MCGIAGWFSNSPLHGDARQRLAAMVGAIRHRGPDGEGMAFLSHAALGHARLAIIDPEGGAQPMGSDGLTVSYNGETYNYRSIRSELTKRGYLFRTRSDTEVILALYRMDGWPALSRLRGMYALALWDQELRTGFLIRDPLGIKPLFFAQAGEQLLFASEAKGILAHGALQAELDESGLHLAMNFRYLPGERTMFRGIRQLLPGKVLIWDPHGVTMQTLPEQHWEQMEPAAALRDSVLSHLTADVEVGAYLSGGMDSAAVTALAKQGGLHRTFTLAVGDDPREASNAASSARLLGVENMQDAPAEEIGHRLTLLVRALEVPKINSLQVSQLAAMTSGNVKVVLSGLGGDELFYGYNAYRILWQAAQLEHWSPRLFHRVVGTAGAALVRKFSRLPWSEAERAMLMLASLGDWPRVYGLLRNLWDTPEQRQMIYGPRMLAARPPDAFELLEELWPAQQEPVTATVHFERREKMVNDLLWQEDRVSMAEGLEVRVPFVDLPLWQSVSGFSRSELMPHGHPKARMRMLLQDLLPAEIMNRPKSGFQLDAAAFFSASLCPLVREWLTRSQLRDYGLFNPDFVERITSMPVTRMARWHYFMLYMMLMSHLWVMEFEGSR